MMETKPNTSPDAAPDPSHEAQIKKLVADVEQSSPAQAVQLLLEQSDQIIAEALMSLNHSLALKTLARFKKDRKKAILDALPKPRSEQWTLNLHYPMSTVGRLMEKPVGQFTPEVTVKQAIEQLRKMVKEAFITYGYVTDTQGRLQGVLVMRDLLLASPSQRVSEIMLRDPFSLAPRMSVQDAVRSVWNKHFPVYPVCDEEGKLIGLARGYALFEEQNTRISAQAGEMVGVEEGDRLATPWLRSFKFRHPWLQINLLTAFLAAAVVGTFEETIGQVVVLAAFLPVLAGQSGNTGCQALAVALRGLTLGDLKKGKEKFLLTKEAWLGFLNGTFVGVMAALGMYAYAAYEDHPQAPMLALVVFLAMIGSCVISGIFGALVPITLKKFNYDPATASSIFVTTATDVASMGLFLTLATWLVL
ncbi:MAG TPA: magnesium transporter [Nitrospiraceae bacterium]|nr:magnesium transporter [Nitrospiraceae bacterium]